MLGELPLIFETFEDLVGEGVVLIGPMIGDQTDRVVNLRVDWPHKYPRST